MKNKLLTIFPLLCLVLFFLHWLAIIVMALPANKAKEMIAQKAPRYKALFGNSWKLFTPPFTYHNRLYFIIRSIDRPNLSDTLEVLAMISQQKQQQAPFNQRENIIDHLVNNNVAALVKAIWWDKEINDEGVPVTKDSAYLAQAIAGAENTHHFKISLASLYNYSKIVFKEQHIETEGKEMKMVIREEMIRPFKELNHPNFASGENLVFETPFKPIQP